MPSSDRPRINLSPDSDLQRDLEDWAEQQKRPVASMALYLLSRSVEEAKKTGEFIPTSEKAARNRTQINILDLQKLADQLEIPSDRLLKAIKELVDGELIPMDIGKTEGRGDRDDPSNQKTEL